mgnify:CR=1 FL=1
MDVCVCSLGSKGGKGEKCARTVEETAAGIFDFVKEEIRKVRHNKKVHNLIFIKI